MRTVAARSNRLPNGIAARTALAVIFSAFGAGNALAGEWGVSNWGELAWGAAPAALPMLGLVGSVILAAAVLGLGMWLARPAMRGSDDPQN